MLGMGLGLWLGHNPAVSGGAPASPATFTMTQLADANRVYQRSSSTGGGQSKGTGTIPVTINATVAGTVYARCRASDGTTVLQNWFLATTLGATGSQTAQIAGVDARLGWFFLDLCGDAGVATIRSGTTLVGMGRVVAVSGQSLAVRMFGRQDGETATNATLGVSINANSSCAASYFDTNQYPTNHGDPVTWATPVDGGNYNSTFCAEYLNRVVTAAGVNCALVGHAQGATSITTYIPAGSQNTELRQRLDGAGGFEAFIWMQGHTDAAAGMSQATYQGHLDTLFTDITAHNAVKGSSYEKYIATMPNIGTDAWGTPLDRVPIRAAGRAWAAANSGTAVDVMDLKLVADTVHESQAGAITLARHFYRASRPSLGLSHNDNGPAFTGSRSGATITLTPTFSSGGSALSAAGTPNNRVSISTKGGYARMPVTSFTVNSGNIVIVLTDTPAANDPLDISFDHRNAPSADGTADMIYDDGTDGESGMTVGRAINPTFLNPIVIAAPTPSLGPTLTGHSVSYASGASGFGNCLSAGYATAGSTIGDDAWPYSNIYTVECKFFISAAPSTIGVMFSGAGGWLGIGTDRKLTGSAGVGSLTGTTAASTGAWHHVRITSDGVNAKLYLDGTLEATVGATVTPGTSVFTIGGLGGASFQFSSIAATALLDEYASFTTALNTGSFTPPVSAYTGSESNLYALYHLNSALTSG